MMKTQTENKNQKASAPETRTYHKLTQAQQENIRWSIRWSDGNKLWKVNHVKGDAWGQEAAQ